MSRSMGRHAETYPDAAVFRPERFEEMNTQKASLADPRKYIFGFGRRYVTFPSICCAIPLI